MASVSCSCLFRGDHSGPFLGRARCHSIALAMPHAHLSQCPDDFMQIQIAAGCLRRQACQRSCILGWWQPETSYSRLVG